MGSEEIKVRCKAVLRDLAAIKHFFNHRFAKHDKGAGSRSPPYTSLNLRVSTHF
jgi:hypothetical protein